jgi:hypothetical protein
MNGLTYAFVLCDQSTLTDAAHGGPLTTAILESIGAAVAKQMNGEVRAEWGCTVSFRVGAADASDVKPGEICCHIQDALTDAPGAAAYHDKLPNGCPVAYFARSDYTSHTTGSESLSVDISHECIETIGDPGANRWADLASGTQSCALELCDPVQNAFYQVDGISVSDFVTQGFFDPGSAGPFDFLGKCPAAGDYSNGYLIARTEDQQASDEMPSKLGEVAAAVKRVWTTLVHGTPKTTQRHARGLSRRARRGA